MSDNLDVPDQIVGKVALITGAGGQDGFFLARQLSQRGYSVHGLSRAKPKELTIEGGTNIKWHVGNFQDSGFIIGLLRQLRPDEVYHLAAASSVATSFDDPRTTFEVNTLGTITVLDSLVLTGLGNSTRVFLASSAEIFGQHNASDTLNESSAKNPSSPYAVSKYSAYLMGVYYREAKGMYVCNGILFNHESRLRDERFVTRKITKAVARIKLGLQQDVSLGNLNSERDWGCADDFTRCMWLMLQQDRPADYVVATGRATTVREFCCLAFDAAGIKVEFHGSGMDAIGVLCQGDEPLPNERRVGDTVVKVDPVFFRPVDANRLIGDASRGRQLLGWPIKPDCVRQIAREMVQADLAQEQARRGRAP